MWRQRSKHGSSEGVPSVGVSGCQWNLMASGRTDGPWQWVVPTHGRHSAVWEAQTASQRLGLNTQLSGPGGTTHLSDVVPSSIKGRPVLTSDSEGWDEGQTNSHSKIASSHWVSCVRDLAEGSQEKSLQFLPTHLNGALQLSLIWFMFLQVTFLAHWSWCLDS